MPSRIIQLIPRHSSRRPNDPHSTFLRTAQKGSFALHESLLRNFPLRPGLISISTCGLSTPKINPPILNFSIRALERALNARDKVEVSVEC